MKIFKGLWEWIKKPNAIMLILFYIIFITLVGTTIFLVVKVQEQSIIHFILYILSAIALTYFVYTIIIFAPTMKANTIKVLQKSTFTKTMLENYGYRTIVFSIFSCIFNIAYLIFLGIMAIITTSYWYMSITAYYLLLSLMKGITLLSKRKHGENELKKVHTYRDTGVMLMLMMIAFSGVIVLIYKTNMYFEYAGLIIFVVATYTFYKLILAIYNLFKARKQDDLYIQNIRNINLASALISIIVLQVALFQAFSPESNLSFANALTGGGVALLIIALGTHMIIKSNKMLQMLETKENLKEKTDGK